MQPDYSRQTALKEIGFAGQATLSRSRVLVVGAGGLGSPVLQYLSGAGVGFLTIVDADVLEPSNLHRQPMYRLEDTGKSKAALAREAVLAINPSVDVTVETARFAAHNALELIAAHDLAIDCSDNFHSKFLLNDAAVLAKKPAVFASVYQFEGQLQTYKPEAGHACLRCMWPDALADGVVDNCSQAGVLGPVPGILGSMQAVLALKILLGLPGQLAGELRLFDYSNFSTTTLRAHRRPACAAPDCTLIQGIAADPDGAVDLTVTSLAEAKSRHLEPIDIRTDAEVAANPSGWRHIPLDRILARPAMLSDNGSYLLVCATGKRSMAAARELRTRGIDAYTLAGGMRDRRYSSHFDSKLPDIGTTIFTVMSRRAAEENALNIGQGFPDYPIDPRLAESLTEAVAAGHNQYAPMEGLLELREQIARKLKLSYGVDFDPATDITVTCGGTEALYDVVQAVVHAGDEVVIFDPAYDAYEPAVRLAGGTCIRIPLSPPLFRFDWDAVRRALNHRTRLVIINSPQNPCCTLADPGDLDTLAGLIRDRPIRVLSDEVYEHVVFDGRFHASVLAHPELRARSYAVFSFGKTLHATGWRVGYCVAPAQMTRELRKVHQFNTFSIAAPLQRAIASYLSRPPDAWAGLSEFFQRKRDLFVGLLQGSAFAALPAQGTYFQLLDYGGLSAAPDTDFADRLIRDAKVAVIPLSPFYAAPPTMTLLRVCIAKRDETLRLAAARLLDFAQSAQVP